MLVTVSAQGQCLETIVHAEPTITRLDNKAYGIRGDVTEFSASSKMRLTKLMARISLSKVRRMRNKPLFLTLTYEKPQMDYERAKRDLKVFIQRLRRISESLSGVWKMELQERGAIHFHLILYDMPFTDVRDLQSAWNEIAEQGALNSLDLEVIRSQRGVIYYTQKYICKGENTEFENAAESRTVGLSIPHTRPRKSGRWWGVINRKGLPLSRKKKIEVHLTMKHYLEWVTGLREKYARCYYSFTVFSSKAYAYFWRLAKVVRDNADLYARIALHKRRGKLFRNAHWMEQTPVPGILLRVISEGFKPAMP